MTQAFQIVSVDRSLTNWGHRHVTAVGTAPKPGFLETWAVASVVKMLAAGDLFYSITSLGEPAFARPFRCWCGFETIRTTAGEEISDGLEGLPALGGGEPASTPSAWAPTPAAT
jgi:hypothetical protein